MITTRKHVEQHISDVTPEMLNLAHLVYDEQRKMNIYLVESTTGRLDDDGYTKEYTVYYIPGKGFFCDCDCGERGFRTKHLSRVCCHCRIAVAHAKEEKAREMARLARATAIALAHSCGMEICSTPDCIQLAGPSGKCNAHTGQITDTGMLAFCAARAAGEDIDLGRPDWMM